MSLVNAYYPDITYHISRRINGRYFLLSPKYKDIHQMVGYAMAYSAKKHSMDIHSFTTMSNHIHIIAHDNAGNLPLFLRDMNRMIAIYINKKFNRRENVWSSEKAGFTILPENGDVLDKILYSLLNPVKAELVQNQKNWPGLIMKPKDVLKEKLVFKRPKQHFSPNTKYPDKVELKIAIPKGSRAITPESYVQYLEERVRDGEEEIKAGMKGRKFMGRRRVKMIPRTFAPKTNPKKSKLNPRVAGKNREVLIMWKMIIKNFRIEYRKAWEEYRKGNRKAKFPFGTYKLRLEQRVCVGT